MIRKFVLVNKNVTDFCCVLEFMDITGSCTVFGNLVGLLYPLVKKKGCK